MAARPVICRRGLAARARALARTMSGSRGPGGRTSRQGRPRRPLCLSARICFIVISLADLPCGVAVDAEPDVAGLALRPTLRAAAAAGVTRRCIGSGIFDSRHAGTEVLSGRQSWCRELGAAVWTGPPESPAWAVWSWTCTVRQVGAEHAHGDRVQCAQRVPCNDVPLAGERIMVGTRGGDAGHSAVAQPGAQPPPDMGVVLDVTPVAGAGAVFGDDLERVALTAVADRNPADLSAACPRVSRIGSPSGLMPTASSSRISGFMVYRWNVRTSGTLARRLKTVSRSRPEIRLRSPLMVGATAALRTPGKRRSSTGSGSGCLSRQRLSGRTTCVPEGCRSDGRSVLGSLDGLPAQPGMRRPG